MKFIRIYIGCQAHKRHATHSCCVGSSQPLPCVTSRIHHAATSRSMPHIFFLWRHVSHSHGAMSPCLEGEPDYRPCHVAHSSVVTLSVQCIYRKFSNDHKFRMRVRFQRSFYPYNPFDEIYNFYKVPKN